MSRWKPAINETYYFVNESGTVEEYTWFNDRCDIELYNVGNCFRTKKEAKAAGKKIKALFLSLHEEAHPKLTV